MSENTKKEAKKVATTIISKPKKFTKVKRKACPKAAIKAAKISAGTGGFAP